MRDPLPSDARSTPGGSDDLPDGMVRLSDLLVPLVIGWLCAAGRPDENPEAPAEAETDLAATG